MQKKRGSSFVYIQNVTADPPIFLLKSSKECGTCGKQNQVVVIGAKSITIDNKPRNQPFLFYYITDMPDILLTQLADHRSFKNSYSQRTGFSYYTNTCDSCNALLGDFNLLSRPEDPLASESSIYDIDIEELAIAETIALRAQIKRLPRAFYHALALQGILNGNGTGS